ncbi:DUF4365 domain-containing protein [Nonomuraea sp. NPDC047529]|uniref:DUF4365 domain-containing protein n=1 Tax=Nonomuraea sp. NPDC047529 TaxID=3155623 RepID=UPI0033FA0B5C
MGNLDISACKEWFSVAYVEALAYAAGYAVTIVYVDHFGVDLELRDRALRVDVQMKCTNEPETKSDHIAYSLDTRTYNLLSDPGRNVPAYLFVVEVPSSKADWVSCGTDGVHLRRCGYYTSMSTLKPTHNKSVKVARANRLTVASLDQLMRKARGGR